MLISQFLVNHPMEQSDYIIRFGTDVTVITKSLKTDGYARPNGSIYQ